MVVTVFVTGGIAAGKSAVCRYLAGKGVPVYDADAETKALYDRDPALVARMEAALGMPLTVDGRLDRKRMAERIFSDAGALRAVEAVVHPAVYDDFVAWRQAWADRWAAGIPWGGYGTVPFVVMESAIVLDRPLFRPLADRIVLIDAPAGLRAERAVARGRDISRQGIGARMARQRTDASGADAVIVNEGDIAALYRAVDAVFLGNLLSL